MHLKRFIPAATGLVAAAAALLFPQSPAGAAATAPAYGPHMTVYQSPAKCLNNPASSQANNTVMIIYTCVDPDVANQDWYFRPTAVAGMYTIENGASHKCLTDKDASIANNSPIIQYTCYAQSNEEWFVKPVGNQYELMNILSEKCLTVKNASTANGATLLQYDCHPENQNDLWSL